MMGPNHAMSGAAAWLYSYPIAEAAMGVSYAQPLILTGAVLTAGAALLPDIDTIQSTISRSFGPATKAISMVVSGASKTVRNTVRGPADKTAEGGHRYLTHTAVMAIGFGAFAWLACTIWGRAALLVLLFVFLGLAVRGLMGDWAKENGWIAVTGVAALGAAVASQVIPEASSYVFVAVTIIAGSIIHCLGDMVTKARLPFLWPLMIKGKRWYNLGLPSFLTFKAGGWFETFCVTPLLGLAAGWGLLRVVSPDTTDLIVREAIIPLVAG